MAAGEGNNVTLHLDLGGEHAKIQHIRCVEKLGEPFVITVEVLVRLGEVDVLEHLGQPIALGVQEWDDTHRYLHGILAESEFTRESRFGYHYALTVRPFTHVLDRNRAFAIFQDKTALEIIKQVFDQAGSRDIDYSRLSRRYSTRSYCVQYGESDFGFISRLMQEEGIYYFFRHESDKHVLVLCDGVGSHVAGSPATLHYGADHVASMLMVKGSKRQRATFHRLTERVTSGAEAKVTLRDFDFEKPDRPREAQWSESGQHAHDHVEIFDYPGRYLDESHGAELGKARLIARRSERQLYIGETQSITLTCGSTVKLADHPAARFNANYLLVRVTQSYTVQAPEDDDTADREREANTIFEAIPANTPFHTPRTIPRPRVRGLETALVSGPAGETIYTDKYGRVKVRFPWDRSDTPGEGSTCWIRVAQFSNLGSVVLPRVGQEVMVDFLHGDPDRPIVCGWVFNAAHMPTYELPANKTRSLWRTQRYGDAGTYQDIQDFDIKKPGANELRFEDKGGSEELFIHAERDMNTHVRHDHSLQVARNLEQKVGHDRTAYVGGEEKITVDKKQTIVVNDKQDETIKDDRIIKANSNDELKVGQALKISAGTTIEVSAGTSITLKVGQQSIVLDQKGITIKGILISSEATAKHSIKGAFTEVTADVTTSVKGGVVMIN